MTTKFFRYSRVEYGAKGQLLPERLAFLSRLPYSAVTEDIGQARRKIRIEFLPGPLMRFLEEVEDQLEKSKPNRDLLENKDRDIATLRQKLNDALETNKKLMEEIEIAKKSAENANKRLIETNNASAGDFSEASSGPFAGYFSKAQESGFIPKGPPLQGGLPSLPKRR